MEIMRPFNQPRNMQQKI